MSNLFKNKNFWCVVAGAAGVIIGKKIIESPKTRELTVNGIAKGMKLHNDAKEAIQNIKDEAADICYDARTEAGLEDAEDTEDTDETEEETSSNEK